MFSPQQGKVRPVFFFSFVEKLTKAHEADASVTPDQQKTEKYKQGLQKVRKTAARKRKKMWLIDFNKKE